jgi:hypothetical protein
LAAISKRSRTAALVGKLLRDLCWLLLYPPSPRRVANPAMVFSCRAGSCCAEKGGVVVMVHAKRKRGREKHVDRLCEHTVHVFHALEGAL